MTSIRPEFHTSLVTTYLDEIFYRKSNLYYFLGKINPWADEDNPPSEPATTYAGDLEVRDHILYLRKVSPTDISLVVPQYRWNPGTVYPCWDHTQNMSGQRFFVVTDDFRVYKCLDNNNGAASTAQPTGISTSPDRHNLVTSDGYWWKYMYTIPAFKRSKFVTDGYVPVQRAITDSFYSKGAIQSVNVVNPGNGYDDTNPTLLVLNASTAGLGANGFTVTSVNPATGAILSIGTTGSAGTGYTAGANVSIISSTGTNALIEPIISTIDGSVTGFNYINRGVGYTIGDLVAITTGGAVLRPVISQTTGEFVDVIIEKSGIGYTYDTTPTITINPDVGTNLYSINNEPGTGAPTSAILDPVIENGRLVRVNIIDPGRDYLPYLGTTIIVRGDGTGARFTPVISSAGQLVDVVVESPGTGYTSLQLVVQSETGVGADLQPVITPSDFVSDQSLIEQTAVDGAIYSVKVTNGGTGYSPATTVQFVGDGTGAAATPVIANGVITKVLVTTPGRGYTTVSVQFVDPNRPTPNNFVNAAAYAILPPAGGHGYNAPKELRCDTAAVYTILRDDDILNALSQDYRQYGLIKDPQLLDTTERASAPSLSAVFDVTLVSTAGLVPDQVLINNFKKYRVVKVDGLRVLLQQLSSIFELPSGTMVAEANPTQSYVIQSIISVPSVNKYSGDLMYVTNAESFESANAQSVSTRTFIKL